MVVNELIDVISKPKAGKHLGDLVTWKMNGEIERSRARAEAEDAELDRDVSFPTLTAINAYKRAISRLGAKGRVDDRDYICTRVQNTGDYIVHQILDRIIVSDPDSFRRKSAQFNHATAIRFNRAAYENQTVPDHGLVEAENLEHPLAVHFGETYRRMLDVYTVDDIRHAFQGLFEKWGGIRVASSGGMWFVPESDSANVRRWAQWMERMGYQALIIPVFDTDDAIRSLEELSRSTMERELADLKEELRRFRETGCRASTLERRVEMFDSLRDKAELYEGVLDSTLADIRRGIDEAQGALMAMIAEGEK